MTVPGDPNDQNGPGVSGQGPMPPYPPMQWQGHIPPRQQPQLPGPAGPQGGGRSHKLPEPSAWTALLSAVPWFFWSLVLIIWIASTIGFRWGWIVVAAWILSAGLIFLSSTEELLAKYLFRLRRPTLVEQERLRSAWNPLLARAGVPGARFSLWIQESDDANATPTPGHTVAVTRWALYTLPPAHLEAALAHELSHHLGGRAWLSLISFWYSIPARGGLIVVRAVASLMRRVPAVGCLIGGFIALAYAGIILAAITFGRGYIWPFLFLTPFVAPPFLAWLNRWHVREADRKAAMLGYGATLVQVLYGWQMQHQHNLGQASTRRAQVMSSTPSLVDRVHTIEQAAGISPAAWG
ncbi:M48 family metalloprotease [Kribbella solani]|uniref:M48 family metalloprotease n=1 Tax=Kribbella solani TaxID=236067 RepID=UPI0029A8605B|nr:M48 family metalloprotease [Kribbella solani]MDX2974320.1 M48 family metalloprotease [Kribbella solani]MDX3003292.1 M48 family metalloprotease [Kribbella solani]